jgi:hypothetical protein
MIGVGLVVAMVVAAVALVGHLRPAAEVVEVSTCALCGRRGLRQRWLAWHHEASHAAEEIS